LDLSPVRGKKPCQAGECEETGGGN